jgi:F-type H+-transporting ATPase subunit a
MSTSPIHQFEIHPILPLSIGGVDVSLTNSGLFMLIAMVCATLFMTVGMGKKALVPGRGQASVEMVYKSMASMIGDAAGEHSKPYFPFIFSVFIFILFANLVGMFPWTFTVTSHIFVTFLLALTVFLVVTVIGFVKHGFRFLSLFVPHGTPLVLAPIIFVLELFSYFVRPFSLAIRLFANMLAGHIILKVFAGMCATMVFATGIAPWLLPLPLAFNVAITGFEFFVAGLQAFIFAILSAVYLHDALELH